MAETVPRTKARWRALWLIAVGVCVLLAVAVAVLVGKRREIARAVIAAQLGALGLPDVTHEVERLGLATFGARNLHVGSDGDLEVDQIEARYTLASLWAGRVEEVTARGVRLHGRMDADGLSLGALDPLLDSRSGDAGAAGDAAPRVALPVTKLALEDVVFTLETPDGVLETGLSIHARDLGGGSVAAEFELEATHPRLGKGSRIQATGSGELRDAQLSFAVEAKDASRHLALAAQGRHDLSGGNGEAQLDFEPLVFRSGGLQPELLLPRLAGTIETATGSVEARGVIRWGRESGMSAGVDLALKELSLKSEQGSVERMNAAIHLDGPSPLSTPARQLVSMAKLDFGLPLYNGLISFRLRPDGVLDLASAEWALAGGKVRTQGKIDPDAKSHSMLLDVVDVDLAELLAMVDLAGLTGSGRVTGSFPVTWKGGTLSINGAKLAAASEGGWIRYQPDAGMAGVASQEQGFSVVLAALENFQYRELSATLNGDTDGPVTVALHLAGANPDYLSGHPIEFNLEVESHLVDLLRDASAAYRIPAEIERRIEAITGASQ